MAMSAEAMNEIFRNSVNAAQECAKKTKDEGQKGIIYATLALAMANTGVISVELSEAAELTPKAESTRENIQPKPAKKFSRKTVPSEDLPIKNMEPEEEEEEPKVEEAAEEPQQQETEEKTFGAEWTDEAIEYFAEETNFVQEHQGKLYEAFYAQVKETGVSDEEAEQQAQAATLEYFNDEVERATSHTCHTQEDINPMNIKYIVEFLKAIERGEEPKDGAYLPF